MQGGIFLRNGGGLVVAAKLMSKLAMKQRHSHIPPYIVKGNPSANRIPIKAVTDAFSSMSKKSAGHRDGRAMKLLIMQPKSPQQHHFSRGSQTIFYC